MRPVYLLAAASGASPPTILDYFRTPFIVTLVVELGGNTSGSPSYTVEYTPDNIWDVNSANYVPVANANWYNHPTLVNLAADAVDSLQIPMTAVRFYTNTAGSGGTSPPRVVVIQAGIRN